MSEGQYEVEITNTAAKQIARINRPDQARILDAIDGLSTEPRPTGVTKMQGGEGWRIKVGNYRVIYGIDDAVRVVNVTRVGHRQGIYDRRR